MNSDHPRTRTPRADTNDQAFDALLEQIRSLVQSARKTAATTINSLQVITSFEIGRMIVEHEQQGVQRAKYGQRVLKTLSDRLTTEFGRGFSRSNLQNMRLFFLAYHDRLSPKRQMPSGKLPGEKSQTASGASTLAASTTHPDQQPPFQLSWSQYVFLLSIADPDERNFYEIESTTNGWTLPELRRQFNSSLYERLALSRNKNEVRRLAQVGQIVSNPKDLMKEPYVLEFLGIDEKATYSESDLETAIIDKLGHFLLELGKGFLFEARQKRFTFDDDHFFVDLVFYNRLLRCYVLIDLKIGRLTHQDLGQMQMYVNYFDRYVKTPDEHPTVGMILCKQKRTALVELTLPKDANIHASQYQLYLPSKEDLQQRLLEWAREEDEQ
jgi:predicted nuclease of restriction endonuclease-like (RecB) superfamily